VDGRDEPDGPMAGDAGAAGPDAARAGMGLLVVNGGAGAALGEPARLYAPDGAGTYVATWVSTERDLGTAVAWADYDHDGDNDFAVASERTPTAGITRIYRNDGDTFTVALTVPRPTMTNDVRWDDFDSDGDVDLLTASSSLVVIYRNDPGGFTAVDAVDARSLVTSIDVADLDGDGDHDLGLATASTLQTYTNNGGVYSPSWQSYSRPATSIRFGDYDNDGAQDFAFAMEGRFGVYRNRGLGRDFEWTLDSVNNTPELSTQAVHAIAWLDFDGDRDLDLVAAEGAWGALTTHRVSKNTSGRFSVGWESVESELSNDVSVGDFDGDGRPDLAFGNWGSPSRIYRNTGGGFTSAWTSVEADHAQAINWMPL
jgi:hypothetical protein